MDVMVIEMFYIYHWSGVIALWAQVVSNGRMYYYVLLSIHSLFLDPAILCECSVYELF